MLRTLVRSFALLAILAGPALAAGDPPADTTSQVETMKAKKKSPRKAKRKAARKSHKRKARKAKKAKKAARAAKPARAKAADRRPTP